jgi:hypothetical protein
MVKLSAATKRSAAGGDREAEAPALKAAGGAVADLDPLGIRNDVCLPISAPATVMVPKVPFPVFVPMAVAAAAPEVSWAPSTRPAVQTPLPDMSMIASRVSMPLLGSRQRSHLHGAVQ